MFKNYNNVMSWQAYYLYGVHHCQINDVYKW